MVKKLKKLTDFSASLSIQRRLQLYFVCFAMFLLLTTTALVNYRVQSDFTTYINAEKRQSLDALAENVQQNYATDPVKWQEFISQPDLYITTINDAFAHFTRQDFINEPNKPVPPQLGRPSLDRGEKRTPESLEVRGEPNNLANQPDFLPPSPFRDQAPQRRPNKPPILPVSLVDTENNLIFGRSIGNSDTHFLSPVTDSSGEVIATFALPKNSEFSSLQQQAYLASFKRTLWIILALGIVFSFLLAKYLANTFTQPIKNLNQATQALKNRDFQTRIPVVSHDELGQLSQSFNQMAHKLATFDEQKRLWMGSISHDLRTPVAVLKAEVESMLDGIKQLDNESLESLQQEINSLTTMLDDFHHAAMSDIRKPQKDLAQNDLDSDVTNSSLSTDEPNTNNVQGRKINEHPQRLNPKPLLMQLSKRSEQAITNVGLSLSTKWHNKEVDLLLSELALTKIWQNLLQNSLRYTDSTPEQKGSIKIETVVEHNRLILTWEDSAPSVPTKLLPRLSEPLFRVEKSRNRQFAGSGLGLSIVNDIVTGDGGRVDFKHSSLGGLKVVIILPIAK